MEPIVLIIIGLVSGMIGSYLQSQFDLIKLKKQHKYEISRDVAARQLDLYLGLLSILNRFNLTGGKSPTERTISVLNMPEVFEERRQKILDIFFDNEYLLAAEGRKKVRHLIQEILWVSRPGYEHLTYDVLLQDVQKTLEVLEQELYTKFEM